MFTLYVSRDKQSKQRLDVGSILCVNLIENLPNYVINVVKCNARMTSKPKWLIGTPTLYNDETDDVLRGNEAVLFLQRLALQEAVGRGMKHTKNKSSNNTTGRSHLMTPGVHLRPEQSHKLNEESHEEGHGEDVDHQNEESNTGNNSLWESRIEEVDEEGSVETAKLNEDDLHRALQNRRPPSAQATENAPPLPPLRD
jgi:hypothetical protein